MLLVLPECYQSVTRVRSKLHFNYSKKYGQNYSQHYGKNHGQNYSEITTKFMVKLRKISIKIMVQIT